MAIRSSLGERFRDKARLESSFRLAWRAFVVATVADFLTTYFALAAGNDEDNVLIAWVLDSHGFIGFAVVKLAALAFVYGGTRYLKPWKPTISFSILAGGAAATGIIAVTNVVAGVALFLYG